MIVKCINDSNIAHNGKNPKKGNYYTVIGTMKGSRGEGYFLDECQDLLFLSNKVMPTPFLKSRFAEVEEIELTELLTNNNLVEL